MLIGYIPANKKIVGCEVMLPVGWLPTTATINVGPSYSTALLISSATTVVGTSKYTMNNPAGQNFVPTSSTSTVSGGTILTYTQHAIYLSLGVTACTAPTAGTIQTILRYT